MGHRSFERASLKDTSISNSFRALFQESLQSRAVEKPSDLDQIDTCVAEAFGKAEEALTNQLPSKKKPWISQATLDLINRRHLARTSNDVDEELRLHKLIKKSARMDRRLWLEDLAGSRSWAALRKLRRGHRHLQGRLNDATGKPVSSEDRAERFAEYFETVQWAVRPATLTDKSTLNEELPVHLGPVTLKELAAAVRRFRPGKASGPDGHPVEYWKAVLENGPSEGTEWLLHLCNRAWEHHVVPQSWHLSRVACIYKKGDPGDCGNYRPICLLNAAYKIYAMVLLRRLIDAGADKRIGGSQFGFRTERGTEDALHCVRRAVEKAWSDRDGRHHLLALDWRKAFDSIDPSALLDALRRFGLPLQFREMVEAIYNDWEFIVKDSGCTSHPRRQMSGIC